MPTENDLVEIKGYQFRVEHKHGLIFLNPTESPVTSCVGVGEDLETARRDVGVTATIFLKELDRDSLSQELINFCLDVYTETTDDEGRCICSKCRANRGELEADDT